MYGRGSTTVMATSVPSVLRRSDAVVRPTDPPPRIRTCGLPPKVVFMGSRVEPSRPTHKNSAGFGTFGALGAWSSTQCGGPGEAPPGSSGARSEEHTSELQSRGHLV